MADKDAANHKHTVLSLHLTTHIADKCPLARLDVPRCQRGGKGALQSGRGSGNHIVQRRCAWFLDGCWVQAVVLGYRSVDTEVTGADSAGR